MEITSFPADYNQGYEERPYTVRGAIRLLQDVEEIALEDFIARLEQELQVLHEAGMAGFRLELYVEGREDDTYAELSVSGTRLETQEEFDQRQAERARLQEHQREQVIRHYQLQRRQLRAQGIDPDAIPDVEP